jgi:hypothetical protein
MRLSDRRSKTDRPIISWQNLTPSWAASGIGHSGFARQIADESLSLIALGNSVKGFLAFCVASSGTLC